MYKLLIVEDDQGIANGIKKQTEAWGLEVRTVENFRNVLSEFFGFSTAHCFAGHYAPLFQRLPLVQ